jgi:hypothetical protein
VLQHLEDAVRRLAPTVAARHAQIAIGTDRRKAQPACAVSHKIQQRSLGLKLAILGTRLSQTEHVIVPQSTVTPFHIYSATNLQIVD